VSLPWAIQRALSPSTTRGAAQLRSTLLTADNKIQWAKIQQLIAEQIEEQKAPAPAAAAPTPAAATAAAAEAAEHSAASDTISRLAPNQPVGKKAPSMGPVGDAANLRSEAGTGTSSPLATLSNVLGAPEGATLRRIAADIDSTELLMRLASREARPLRHMSVDALATALADAAPWRPRAPRGVAWPSSETSLALARRRTAKLATVTRVLLRRHLEMQLRRGWRGVAAMAIGLGVVLRVGFAALAKAAVRAGAELPPIRKALPALASVVVLGRSARELLERRRGRARADADEGEPGPVAVTE
jgi:hypothetical protein